MRVVLHGCGLNESRYVAVVDATQFTHVHESTISDCLERRAVHLNIAGKRQEVHVSSNAMSTSAMIPLGLAWL